jgi:hypothetical protein
MTFGDDHLVTKHIETTQNLSALKVVPAVAQLGTSLAERSMHLMLLHVISFGRELMGDFGQVITRRLWRLYCNDPCLYFS